MTIRDLFNSIGRRIRFWYYTTTPAFKDYSMKIQELDAHSMRLRSEAGKLNVGNASIPDMNIAEPEELSIQQFSPPEKKWNTKTMVMTRREYQGGAENGNYELGDRFDVLCNHLDDQMRNGDRKAALTTLMALKEIDSRLHHKDKREIVSKLGRRNKLKGNL